MFAGKHFNRLEEKQLLEGVLKLFFWKVLKSLRPIYLTFLIYPPFTLVNKQTKFNVHDTFETPSIHPLQLLDISQWKHLLNWRCLRGHRNVLYVQFRSNVWPKAKASMKEFLLKLLFSMFSSCKQCIPSQIFSK